MRDDADEWRDHDSACRRLHRGERADYLDRRRIDADFFVSLAQSGVEQGGVDGIDAAAGERDLPAMTGDVIGSADIDDVKFAAALEDRYQDGGGVGFVRERLARRRRDS